MKIETVIFDLDGTLIDSLEMYYKVLAMAFSQLDLPMVGREIVFSQFGRGTPDWDSLLPKGIENKKDIMLQCREIIIGLWPKVYREEVDLFEGVPDLLRHLKDKSMTLGIATSGQSKELIIELLTRRKVYDLISAIVSREEVPKPKPSPMSILECLRRLDAPPEKSVYVGDSIVDIRASKAAGIRSVAVLSGAGNYDILFREGPDYIIPNACELPALLDL
ncbi:MAG: HAD family hydrolase [Syntrophomonadaceae bacterium]|nr:HAD family hydrolase [Syntrophomonadaceae bacterium]